MSPSAPPLILPPASSDDAPTARTLAYRRLRRAIMIGAVAPGQSLTIRQVAAALQTSPTPAREALRQLVAEGALVSLPNRRLVTPPMSDDRYRRLIATRTALECLALESAMAWINAQLVEQLRADDRAIDDAVAARDFGQVVLRNQAFHSRLICADPAQVVLPLVEQLWLQLGPFMRLGASELGAGRWKDWHPELLDALAARDLERALRALRADIGDNAALARAGR